MIHEEHADPPGCNCVYCEEYRRGRSERLDAVTICGAPAKLEDRMLLLKALWNGKAFHILEPEHLEEGVRIGRTFYPCDPNKPLTDELRSALTKATHG